MRRTALALLLLCSGCHPTPATSDDCLVVAREGDLVMVACR